MKIPNSVINILRSNYNNNDVNKYINKWFLLTLNNYKFLEDGDQIMFINRYSKEVRRGHLFHSFNNDWTKMRIYYNTVRKIKTRIVEVDIAQNLFIFHKVKPDDAFCVFYLLNGLENGHLQLK